MDYMQMLELARSVALIALGAWIVLATIRLCRVEENARYTAIAQHVTDEYATKRFAETRAEICKLKGRHETMVHAYDRVLDRFTDDGR